MDLILDNTWQSIFLTFLTGYTRLNVSKRVNIIRFSESTLALIQKGDLKFPAIPCLITDKPEVLTNVSQISAFMSQISSLTKILYGQEDEDNDDKAQISQGFKQVFLIKDDVLLEELNKHLASRTFYAASHINIADLAFFSRVYKTLIVMSDELKLKFNNLFRWYNYVQHLPEVERIIRENNLSFSSYPFSIPEPFFVPGKSNKKAEKPKGGDPELRAKALEKKQQEQQAKPEETQEKQPKQQKQPKQEQTPTQEQPAKQEKQAPKQEKQPKQPQQQQQPAQTQSKDAPKKGEEEKATLEEFAQLDLRVGKIVECWKHPESENLYCEKVDMGNGEIREIASGLQKFVKIDDMSGLVIVAYNLKPRSVAGFTSNGMVIAASNKDKTQVELVRPGPNAKVGERVFLEGHEKLFSQEKQPQLNPKKKILEKCFPTMHTDSEFTACYLNQKWTTSDGYVKSNTIANGTVS